MVANEPLHTLLVAPGPTMESSINVLLPANHKRTCEQCRFRKVRCDGNVSQGCVSCNRLHFDCSFLCNATRQPYASGVQPVHPEVARRPPKRRSTKACLQCRKRKVGCSGDPVQCASCARQGTQCVYPSSFRARRVVRNENDAPALIDASPETQGSPQGYTLESAIFGQTPLTSPTSTSTPGYGSISSTGYVSVGMIELFLETIYPLPSYSFVHPSSLRGNCVDGTIEESLALAIRGMTTLLCPSDPRSHDESSPNELIEQSEQIIWKQLGSASVPRLQALLLITRYRIETGCFQRAFMIAALAARMVSALHLNHERMRSSFISQELRRRVVWSFKLLENYFSNGLPEHELCPFETIYLQYPCRETDFDCRSNRDDVSSGDMTPSDAPIPDEELGAYSCCVRLASVRRDIMKLTRSVALCDTELPQLPALISEIERELKKIKTHMPNDASLSSTDLSRLINSRWLPRHIMMYLSWHQCHCDLYRLLLPGYQEAAPPNVLAALDASHKAAAESFCLQHASSIVRILSELNHQSTQARLLEYDTAICAYHSTRLLLFLSQHGQGFDRPAPEFALSRAQLCLAALRRFFPSSVLVNPVIRDMERLITTFEATNGSNVHHRLGGAPDQDVDENRDGSLTSRLSQVARTRQRLAIHSLLRQAEFSDDDNGGPSN